MKWLLGLLAALCLLAAMPAAAQLTITVPSCGTLPRVPALGSAGLLGIDQTGNLCVSASVSASISGFNPTTTGTPIAATTSGVTGSISSAVVVATNVGGTNVAYCKLGASATTSDQAIAPNFGWFAFTTAGATQLTCITSTSTTTVNIVGGTGLPTGTGGGGGSSSGGGGAVTVADGADVAQGTTTDAACATDNGTCTELSLLKRAIQRLTIIITTLGSPFQAGGTVTVGNTCAGGSGQQVMASSCPVAIASNQSSIPVAATLGAETTKNIGTVSQLPYPSGATPITASNTGTTGATTATLAGTSGKTTYICGYSIRANATAATTVTNTITGVITATLSSIMWIAPLASGLGVDEQIFSPCIPASGTNQAIAIVSGAPGSGGTVSSKGWGYQL